MDNINLNLFAKDGDKILEALKNGNMIVARSKNDFLYILDYDGKFHMFSHTPGSPGGGQKQFPKDEKHTAVVHKLAIISDTIYLVEFDKDMNIYGVMSSAEEGILSLFPGDDRDRDKDSEIEFVLPDKNNLDNNNNQ